MGGSNIFRQTPGRVLLAFAITAGLIAIYTAVDASRRGYEEGYDFPTALGDDELFPVAAAPVPAPSGSEFMVNGEPFYRQKSRKVKRYDRYMFKAGREDGDRFYVYRYRNRNRPAEDASPQGVVFVKIGESEYLKFADHPRHPPSGDGGE